MNNKIVLNEQNSYEIINEVISIIDKILSRIDEIDISLNDLEIDKVWVCQNANYFKMKCTDKLKEMKNEYYILNERMQQLINNISNIKSVDKNVIKALNGEKNL